ncbi:Gar1/Naf1 RNA binding region-domain-containing protein [Massariosphaeria phaeospora]|uniref:H/ACA ribonucleoprotein complex non-core subunit NAF1 n=1 Tax=Massariosphaeria phaeospora TaxID=100035 RepID=A0A7C8II13_9PLEO|nr:Gar1/Naf1 RNA binding region-domain-containing protein [Massariosphaeria phaeospora]
MSNSVEPPTKRARLDLDGRSNGTSTLDVPSSPIDDLDDDFYDTAPTKPASGSVDAEDLSASAEAASASASFSASPIPGLGFLGHPPPVERSSLQNGSHTVVDGDEADEGEISDSEAFYSDVKTAVPATAEQQTGWVAPNDDAFANPTATDPDMCAPKAQEDSSVVLYAANQDSTNVVDSKADFLRVGEVNKGNNEAEWQIDSENSDLSSDASSDDSSSDEDDDDKSEEGELLGPEEQIRRLMEESANEPVTSEKAKVRTLNEVVEEYKKPDITVTDETRITELGHVESIVDNLVLIKAKVSGDYQVLESESALCLGNRTVIGQVSETIGRVQEPRYTLGFSDPAEIAALGISKDTSIFYVNEHSTFVFTEPLRAQKHTDASDLHDEETHDVEFSDDEKEAEHKKSKKDAKKRAWNEANRDPQEEALATAYADRPSTSYTTMYQGGGLNYSDDDEEGMYRPLTRPDRFEEIVGAGAPLEDRSHVRRGMLRGGRGGWPDRGRGFRGRGGGGGGARGDRGGGGGARGDRGRGGARGDRGGGGARADRGANGGRGSDRNSSGGRGDRSRNDRGGGAPGGRGDRGGGARGDRGRFARGQSDRHGKGHEQHRQRDVRQQENRSVSSSSPGRQNRGRSSHRSPPGGNASGNSRRRSQQASPAPASRPPASTNASAYAYNNEVNPAGYAAPYSNSAQSSTTYSTATGTAGYTGISAGAYASQYAQQAPAQAPAQPSAQAPAQAPAQDPQQLAAQWAQWFQYAAAMQNQGQAQPQPQSQPQAAPQQSTPQANSTPNWQEILRAALGRGSTS